MTNALIAPPPFRWADLERARRSLGLRNGAQVYLSGVLASDGEEPKSAAGTMGAQARVIYGRIAATLESAGSSLGDIVKIVEYVQADAFEQYSEAEGVRKAVLGPHRPAVNTVVVKALPDPDASIAIEATAGARAPTTSPEAWLPTAAESEGVVYLPNVLALDAKGEIVAPGDIVGQTQAIFERASATLAGMGLGMDHVVMTTDHPTPEGRAGYKHLAPIRQSFLGPVYPGAAGIVMPRLAVRDAVIQYEFIATRDQLAKVDTGWRRYDALTYNAAVRAGKLLFMSGQSARDPVSGIMPAPDDVLGQAEAIYNKIDTVLAAAGAQRSNLVSLIEYVVPRSAERYRDIGSVRERMFHAPFPVVSGAICDSLLRRDMEIEIVPFAILDWERQ